MAASPNIASEHPTSIYRSAPGCALPADNADHALAAHSVQDPPPPPPPTTHTHDFPEQNELLGIVSLLAQLLQLLARGTHFVVHVVPGWTVRMRRCDRHTFSLRALHEVLGFIAVASDIDDTVPKSQS